MFYKTQQITDRSFLKTVNNLCKEFTKVSVLKIERILKKDEGGKIYILFLNNKGKMRLDVKPYNEEEERTNYLRKLAEENKVNVSKLLKIFQIEKRIYRFNEWISGDTLYEIRRSGNTSDNKEIYFKFGQEVGKLYSIKENDLFLCNNDMGLTNIVWTPKKEIFFIDHGKLCLQKSVDIEIVKILLKRIRNKEMSSWFLEGYSNYFDVKNILEICNKRDWIWKKIRRK